MFTTLSEQITGVLQRLTGRGVLAESDVTDALREIPAERADPGILNGSRRLRIATGSGRPVQEVNRLLEQFQQMRKLLKRI